MYESEKTDQILTGPCEIIMIETGSFIECSLFSGNTDISLSFVSQIFLWDLSFDDPIQTTLLQ